MIYRFAQYVLYCLRRLRYVRGRDVHSPRVFDLVENVFQVPYTYYIYKKLENRRGQLIRQRATRAQTLDWGDSPDACQLMHKLCVWRRPETLLVAGDRVGLTTQYLQAAAPQARLLTEAHGDCIVDLALLDCGAQAEQVMQTYSQLRLDGESLVIVDRIRQNRAMGQAWNQLRRQPPVSSSIDCFDFGILLYEKHLERKTYVF